VNLRQTTKQVIERALRLAAGHPSRMAGRTLILAYHNVVPDGEQGRGDRSLHLAFSSFRRQLDLLQTHCTVSPLGEIFAAEPIPGRPRVVITFDDAYRGAVELALPELNRRGLPSTLFVAPGLLGTRSFWWDELATPAGDLSSELRTAALEVHAGHHDRIRKSIGRNATEKTLPMSYGCVSEDQIRTLRTFETVTIGAHGWGHSNLTRIGVDELAIELLKPLEWLRTSGIPMVPILAYPYGLASRLVEEAAERVGYAAALLVEGGWLGTSVQRPWAVPRYNVPAGLSTDGLILRLSGVLPA
jgi:peptidoglycan/xylan/chitin deacetylase (PgdA/CDA1 family)